MPTSHPIFIRFLRPGLDALLRLWRPFLAIQLFALVVIVVYFNSPAMQTFCRQLAAIKTAGGFPLSALTMSIACGIVPEIFKLITGVDRTFTTRRFRTMLFHMALFALSGVMVDLYYRGLARWPGESTSAAIVVLKVVMDQFLYCPIVGVPMIAIAYQLRTLRYRLWRLWPLLNAPWYVDRVGPMLLPCWGYWIPMTALMYCLPNDLQFIFGALASGASATLLTTVAAGAEDRSST